MGFFKFFTFLAFLAAPAFSQESKEKDDYQGLSIEHAFRTLDGNLVICFASKSSFKNERPIPRWIDDNRCFFGTEESGFSQLSKLGGREQGSNFRFLFETSKGDNVSLNVNKNLGLFYIDCNKDPKVTKMAENWVTDSDPMIFQNEMGFTVDKAPKSNISVLDSKEIDKLNLVIRAKKAVLKPLPEIRRAEYLFKGKDGEFIYIDSAKYEPLNRSLRVFKGPAGELREIPVARNSNGSLRVDRVKDGGTTSIELEDESEIYISSKGDGKSAFFKFGDLKNPIQLEKMDPKIINEVKLPDYPVSTKLVTFCDEKVVEGDPPKKKH